jgi:hypothetical protein
MSDKAFPKSKEKILPQGWSESIDSMDTEEIKKKVFQSHGHLVEIERAKEEDEALTKAVEEAKGLGLPYKESAAIEKAKIAYCFYALESRGVDISK